MGTDSPQEVWVVVQGGSPKRPSPYVSFYITRRQAMHVERALEQYAGWRSVAHPAAVALKRVRDALERNA